MIHYYFYLWLEDCQWILHQLALPFIKTYFCRQRPAFDANIPSRSFFW